MLEKRRSGRTSTKTSIRDEIAHLRGLDLKGLRSRWQSVFQRPPPDLLPRHLMFAIIAYRIQADRLGDLDNETKQVLDRTDAKDTGAKMSARLVSSDRRSQRVMVMADGFAWNGQTYDSLSKVAFAITGTKWNGPRFFGLRDKEDRLDTKARS
jgi:ABC-type glutathione transport system ATPase component